MQQCNFPIEIIINDDCSTDGTTEIIREYAEKYPDEIFPIFHEENLYSQGVRGMFQKFVFPKARGKYIALCEGDDYWTDPLKLQKQVDFLETHPDYSMCWHKCQVLRPDGQFSIDDFDFLEKREYSFEEIAIRWSIPTASAVYRSTVLPQIPQNINFAFGDNVVFFTCAQVGRIYCLGEIMSVYRKHAGGWTEHAPLLELTETFIRHNKALIESFPEPMHHVFRKMLADNYIYLQRIVYSSRPIYTIKLLFEAFRLCRTEYLTRVRATTRNPFLIVLCDTLLR